MQVVLAQSRGPPNQNKHFFGKMLSRQQSEIPRQGMGCLVYGNEILINTLPPLVHRSRKTDDVQIVNQVNQDLATFL